MPLLLVLAACDPAAESGASEQAPPFWDSLHEDLDPFRELLAVPVGSGSRRMLPVSGAPSLAVWPGNRGGVALLDGRYRLDDAPRCLDPAPFPNANDGADRQGACAAGEVELDRTGLAVGEEVVDVADDPAGKQLFVLLRDGSVRKANTDLLRGNPFDYLRLQSVGVLVLAGGGEPERFVALPSGGWAAAAGQEVAWFDELGGRTASATLAGAVEALVWSGESLWAVTATGAGPVGGPEEACSASVGITPDGEGGVWMACGERGLVLHVDSSGGVLSSVEVALLVGPIARHPVSGALYAATEQGVAELRGGVEVAQHAVGRPDAIVVNGVGEVSVLVGGSVSVFVDETALSGRPPLSAWVAAFVENPRAVASRVECSGAEDGMEERAERAVGNRALFDDVPPVIALAVSPAVASHARRCKVSAEFSAVAEGDRVEPGVLFHDPPECSEQGCLDDAILAELEVLADLDVSPRFAAGAAGWETGGDWVVALEAAGLDRHAFVGLSAFPEVGIDDPRGKDAAPWSGEAEPRPWRTSSAEGAAEHDAAGGFLLVPGSTLAIFNSADCAGALQAECRMLGLGGGSTIEADDIAVADLLLHRAAAQRGTDGISTWYFHLPAVEEFSYLEGCTRGSDGRWSGEGCEAELLQSWLVGVHARLVNNGVLRWGSPSEAEAP